MKLSLLPCASSRAKRAVAVREGLASGCVGVGGAMAKETNTIYLETTSCKNYGEQSLTLWHSDPGSTSGVGAVVWEESDGFYSLSSPRVKG
jgi:hypothetical protein